MRPRFEVAQLLQDNWHWVFGNPHLSSHQKRTLAALRDCRTSALGGHADVCTSCGTLQISYNSCRNRHCPKCQNTQRQQWIKARQKELLPIPYFHVVFTIPACLNPYCQAHPRVLYNTLFKAAWNTLRQFAADPKQLGAKTGATMVLHTWGQNLMLHPHLHCIVPGGGLSKNGKWKNAQNKGTFLFPVKAMSKVFRAKFVALLRKSELYISHSCYKQCFQKAWVVYAKRPFLGPPQVIEYLGRYTHKIAISNHRIQDIALGLVQFIYKDYKQAGIKKSMALSTHEFIRRFALHILPHRFVRIRHYGLFASRYKAANLSAVAQQLNHSLDLHSEDLDWKTASKLLLGFDPDLCRHCGGHMIMLPILPPSRAPPYFNSMLKSV